MTVTEKLYYSYLRLALVRAIGKKDIEAYRERVTEQERYIEGLELNGVIIERFNFDKVLISSKDPAMENLENINNGKQEAIALV